MKILIAIIMAVSLVAIMGYVAVIAAPPPCEQGPCK